MNDDLTVSTCSQPGHLLCEFVVECVVTYLACLSFLATF